MTESYEVSKDGKTITFKIRPGLKFHSGNPVRAEDVAWSLQRVVKLNKTPAFIITQFGWTAENVDSLVKAVDSSHLQITITEDFSPGTGAECDVRRRRLGGRHEAGHES